MLTSVELVRAKAREICALRVATSTWGSNSNVRDGDRASEMSGCASTPANRARPTPFRSRAPASRTQLLSRGAATSALQSCSRAGYRKITNFERDVASLQDGGDTLGKRRGQRNGQKLFGARHANINYALWL